MLGVCMPLERRLTAIALLFPHDETAEQANGEEHYGTDDAADGEVGFQRTSLRNINKIKRFQ